MFRTSFSADSLPYPLEAFSVPPPLFLLEFSAGVPFREVPLSFLVVLDPIQAISGYNRASKEVKKHRAVLPYS